ncbi:hypothetical protein AJ79_05045 [Helicocarpus griseus UAMH5409]|uniref:Uncharacterized protein n=1 Tax=Helicocarpus griseus UAMH5409 TaxID=1447875 RepID=A0A2B7XQ67_9EURO|nr:hypothetical protein AJ79_05045 [Helicocarpus griseus UAMH5409]
MPRRRPKLGQLYPTEPGPIFCWICGDSLEGATWSKDEMPPFAYCKQEWNDAWERYRGNRTLRKRKFSLDAQASDLAFGFSSCDEWTLFFILGDCAQDYQLTGIGYMPGGRTLDGRLFAPRDPETACLGAGKANFQTLRVYPIPHPFSENYYKSGDEKTSFDLNGYVLHSRCWDLLERLMGPTQATLHLDKITTALRAQWNDIITSDPSKEQKESSGYRNDKYPPNDIVSVFKHRVPLEIKYLISEHFGLKYVPVELLFELKNGADDVRNNDSYSNGDRLFAWDYIAVEIERRDILGSALGIGNRRRILRMLIPISQNVMKAIDSQKNNAKSRGSSVPL